MTQLTYNEAFDPYHASFRIMRLNTICKFETAIPFDAIRILDFFLLFPFRMQRMSFKSNHRSFRRISKVFEQDKPYGVLPDDQIIFTRMEPFQRAAVSTLAMKGIVSTSFWAEGSLKFPTDSVPHAIAERCVSLNAAHKEFVAALRSLSSDYELYGKGGLKDRSGLLEFRYDAI